MQNYQTLIFDWVAAQGSFSGLVVLGAGLVTGLQGFRFVRALTTVCGCGVGYFAGSAAGELAGLPTVLSGIVGCLTAGIISFLVPRPAFVIANGAVWAALAAYLINHFGPNDYVVAAVAGLLGAAGFVLALISRKQTVVLFASVLGAAVIVIGLVGVAHGLAPVLGTTFRSWGRTQSPVIPVFLAMIATTVYSYQANAKQGAIETGRQSDVQPTR